MQISKSKEKKMLNIYPNNNSWKSAVILVTIFLICGLSFAVDAETKKNNFANNPDRIDWFEDMGFGMFIHWSVDSQLGAVISHSMVGASDDYLGRFINDLPKTFCPKRFDPNEWARLAKLAGMKYVVFTTKHASGFCMFSTKTTDFGIMNTPYKRDITRQIFDAFRRQGIAIGVYYCPDDFCLLHKQGHHVSRDNPEAMPANNPELMALNKAQMRELLSNYGKIDILFLDGMFLDSDNSTVKELKELAWQIQPNIVITRGEMKTPEERVPDKPMPGPWETCDTMGNQWHYKPTNENYKTGTDLINNLIEIRAKGGNYLLNVGPTPDGPLPFEQIRLLEEMALWMFINNEAIYNIRPWHVACENNIWFTKAKDSDTVYAFITKTVWPYGERKEFTLKSVKATDQTQAEILGQSGKVLEYDPNADAKTTWKQDENGLHISAMRAQRIYNNNKWPNPIVIKITHAKPVN